MQFTAIALTLASAALASAQQTLMVNTPTSVVECLPVALSWSGGTAPYYVSIIPGGQAGATALESFPTQTGNSYTWTADIAAGTSITVQIRDSTGAINYSDKVTIQQGTSTSCQGQGSGSAGTSAAASSSAAAGTTAAAAGTTAAAAGTTSAAAAGTTTRATSAASKPASSAAAGASSVASAATTAASSVSSSTSGAEKIGAGLFTVVAGAFFAIFA